MGAGTVTDIPDPIRQELRELMTTRQRERARLNTLLDAGELADLVGTALVLRGEDGTLRVMHPATEDRQ